MVPDGFIWKIMDVRGPLPREVVTAAGPRSIRDTRGRPIRRREAAPSPNAAPLWSVGGDALMRTCRPRAMATMVAFDGRCDEGGAGMGSAIALRRRRAVSLP